MRPTFAWFFLALFPFSGCLVSTSRYNQAVTEANVARDDSARLRQQIRVLRAQLATMEATLQTRETNVSELDASVHNLQTRLQEATAIHEELQTELHRLGANMGSLVKDREALQQALDDAKTRLVQLRALQAAAEARDAAVRSVAQSLAPWMEAKQIEMATRDGQTVLVIPASVLFESDHTAIRRSGEPVLEGLAHALSTSPDWRVRIAVYSAGRMDAKHHHVVFDRSAVRASHVADRLVDFGLSPSSLWVAGYLAPPSMVNAEDSSRIEVQFDAMRASTVSGGGPGPPQ